MTIKVTLNTALAELADGNTTFHLEGATVLEALRNLAAAQPPLAALLWRGEGLNTMLVAFRNQDDIRQLQGLETPLANGDELALITAIEGG